MSSAYKNAAGVDYNIQQREHKSPLTRRWKCYVRIIPLLLWNYMSHRNKHLFSNNINT